MPSFMLRGHTPSYSYFNALPMTHHEPCYTIWGHILWLHVPEIHIPQAVMRCKRHQHLRLAPAPAQQALTPAIHHGLHITANLQLFQQS
jgi:hypothetical protein